MTAPRPDAASAEEALWSRAEDALALLAVDPSGLGGVWARVAAGPVQDRLRAEFAAALAPWETRRVPARVSREALTGGLDVMATLARGRLRRAPGLLAGARALTLSMAERLEAPAAAALSAKLDQSAPLALLAIDEGEGDEALSPMLRERLAFHLPLREARPSAAAPPSPERIAAARRSLVETKTPPETFDEIAALAAALGVGGLRAPLFALRAARASAALEQRDTVAERDLERAIRLVLAPRAAPPLDPGEAAPEPEPAPPPDEEARAPRDEEGAGEGESHDREMLVEAARSRLPEHLLDQLAGAARQERGQSGTSGAGGARLSARRGRPLPSRRGRLSAGARLDLPATLRAAAPWQGLRARRPDAPRIVIRPDDLHLRRYREMRARAILFVVDASGSTAMARLAEAKGAVELLLGEAYASRDHVGLIAFRGRGAETLLAPTRSLTRARRALSGLPGGGGTPLALALAAALREIQTARRGGMSPSLCLLTDGRGNIALDGASDRARAAQETERLAALLRADGAPALLVDPAPRPADAAKRLAEQLSARYLPLPRNNPRRLADALAAPAR